MKKKIKKIIPKKIKAKLAGCWNRQGRGVVLATGFHGDQYFLGLIEKIAPDIEIFIETGANVGSTTRYMATTYPHVSVYSCEPDGAAFQQAQRNLAGLPNARLYQMLSPEFLYHLYAEQPQLKTQRALYWLDAHGYGFNWPLHDEIAYITREMTGGFIFIDDVKIPDQPQFKYAEYAGQICDRTYIVNALTPGKTYQILYPAYSEHTSPHHPLIGYIGIGFGSQGFGESLPDFTIQVIHK